MQLNASSGTAAVAATRAVGSGGIAWRYPGVVKLVIVQQRPM
ncbi:MAG: hypothetical protein Q7U26_15820 [Aquabacterium sp.]|nr:hypothetical protein [Aquabacterium sp.]